MADASDPFGFDPTLRDNYRHWTTDKIRWGDMDSMGHVNNVQVGRYVESGRIAFGEQFRTWLDTHDRNFTLARVVINFRREVRFPGDIEVGSRLIRIGQSSIHLVQGLFSGETCTGTAEGVMVLIENRDHETRAIPDDLRKLLEATMI